MGHIRIPYSLGWHHLDYYICSREPQPEPSFVTGILGGRSKAQPMTQQKIQLYLPSLACSGTGNRRLEIQVNFIATLLSSFPKTYFGYNYVSQQLHRRLDLISWIYYI